LVLLALAAPAWANGTSHSKLPSKKKNDTRYGHHFPKFDKHKIKVLKEFRVLKWTYNKSIEDARQMFLEFLGTGLPSSDADIQQIRQEYEQQIAQLNATIAAQQDQIAQADATVASQQQQIAQLNQTITSQAQQLTQANATIAAQQQQLTQSDATIASLQQQLAQATATIAAQQQQLTQADATIAAQQQQLTQDDATIAALQQQLTQSDATIASLQQQIVDLNTSLTSLQAQMDALVASQQATLDSALAAQMDQLTQQCNDQLITAYNDGKADGLDQCPSSGPAGPPQQVDAWNTGSVYPYAVDVDGSGNVFALDKDTHTVAVYDSTGASVTQWTPTTLSNPIDIAVDGNGDVYVLDDNATASLQKYTPNGQLVSAFSPSVSPSYPTGLFIDNSDTIYVTDQGGGAYGSRILTYDTTGAFRSSIGEVPQLTGEQYLDVAVDEQNQLIYVVTYFNLIAKLDMNGGFISSWGDSSTLRYPNSIAVGAQGQVFVADTNNDEIDQYDTDGNLMYTVGSGDLYRPRRIAVDNTGRLFVADESNLLIRIYQ